MKTNLSGFLFGLILALSPLSAFATTGVLPFGGLVIGTPIPCTCAAISGAEQFLIYVGYPMGGSYIYQVAVPGVPSGTQLFSHFAVLRPGAYLLGTAEPVPMACMVYAGTSCVPAGFGPMMLTVGTSY